MFMLGYALKNIHKIHKFFTNTSAPYAKISLEVLVFNVDLLSPSLIDIVFTYIDIYVNHIILDPIS